jgi:hypothetical protein
LTAKTGTVRECSIEHQSDRMGLSGISGDGLTCAVIIWQRA